MARKTTSAKKSTPRKTSTTRKETPIIKQQKPVFRLGTLVAVLVLVISVGAAFYINREKEATAAEATPTGEGTSYVFDVESGNIASIEVKPAEGEAVKLARDESNAWAIVSPFETEADQGLAEAAATQISSLVVVSEIDDDPEIFGLDSPVYVITVELVDGKTHTLEVGDITPTNSGYYVRVDQDKMMIVSLSGIDSLINLATFPPYLNTPTPTAPPATETPVPPTETPEATVTPTP